ncbi:MAG: right-handed parallel beta-helix repeat-containing protein, partial [Planctomycetota bacterium]
MIWKAVILTTCLIVGTAFQQAAAAPGPFYVSLQGNDSWSGTLPDPNAGNTDGPFATIEGARDALRGQTAGMTSDVTVFIRGGTYRYTSALTFDERDGGKNGFNIIYAAHPGERPVISGGIPVTGWTQVAGTSQWKTTVPVGAPDVIRQFYVNGKVETRARLTNTIPPAPNLKHNFGIPGGSDWYYEGGRPAGVYVSKADLPAVTNAGEMDLFWAHEWRIKFLPVENISDAGDGRWAVKLEEGPAFTEYTLDWPYSQDGMMTRATGAFDFVNAHELLDTPGEWYFNRVTRELFYWPEDGGEMSRAEAVVPVVDPELMSITGSSAGNKVRNLHFRGLTFAHTGWTLPSTAGFVPDQAEMLYAPGSLDPPRLTPASIRIDMAEEIVFERNVIMNMGAVGIGLHEGVDYTNFVGNIFSEMAEAAMTIGAPHHEFSGDVCTNNTIRNNVIRKTGREFWSAPSIQAFSVTGMDISYNDLKYSSYSGIASGWGWGRVPTTEAVNGNNTFMNNKALNGLEFMGDGGGLYLLGYNGENGEVSGNYVNGGPRLGCLIYFDMGTTGFRVVDNVAENGSMRGFNISGGSNMVMQRNYTDVQGWHSVCDPCDIERPFLYEPGDQPPAALDIMANAGLEPSYRDLLDADGEPILAVNKRLPEGKKTVPFFLIPY